MEPQRDRLIDRALRIAHAEAGRQSPAVGLLTGSAAWGTLSARSDIDIIFVPSEPGAVSYRYYLPELTEVDIRTEVGRIPLPYLKEVLAAGYYDEISTGIREQLRNARFLLGDEKLGRSLIAGFDVLKPKKRLLGEYLHNAREALKNARAGENEKDRIRSAIAIHELAKNLWRLILVSIYQVGVQKDKHEIRAARRELAPGELESYRLARRVSNTGRTKVEAILRASRDTISRALSLVGVEDRILGESEV